MLQAFGVSSVNGSEEALNALLNPLADNQLVTKGFLKAYKTQTIRLP